MQSSSARIKRVTGSTTGRRGGHGTKVNGLRTPRFRPIWCLNVGAIKASPVDGPHSLLRIARAGGRPWRQETVYLREFLWGKTNIKRADIFL